MKPNNAEEQLIKQYAAATLPKELMDGKRHSPLFYTSYEAYEWASSQAVAYGRSLAGLSPIACGTLATAS